MGTEGFKGVLLLILMIASLMVPAIATTTVSAPSTFSASPGATLSPTSARANTSIKFTVTVTNDYAADNIDNVLLKASGFTQPTDLEPTTWTLSTVTEGARFDAIGDNVITPGGSETFVFLWTTPNITTQKDYMISVLVSKEETIYTAYENLGGLMVTIDGKKPTLTINVTQVGVTPAGTVNVVGTTLDNAKATITITASETLQSIGPVTVENSGNDENFLPPITMTTTDNLVYTGTFTVGAWDDNAPVVKVASAKDLVGNENTNIESSFTVDTRAPIFIENGLSALVSGMRDNVVQAGTGTIFRYVDNDASKGIIIRVEDNIANADNGKWVTSVTIDTTAATRDPTIDSRWTKTIILSEGLNSIVKVTATDRTGNSVSDNVENIFIDTRPPAIEYNTVAGKTWDENGELINDNTPEIKITVTDPGYSTSGLGVAYGNLDVYLNDTGNIDNINQAAPYGSLENKDPWVVPTGVFENLIDNAGKGLVDGTYWIIVRANDNLAHAGDNENWAIAKRSFTIDTSKPVKDVDIVVYDKIGGTADDPNVYRTVYRTIEGTVSSGEVGGTIKVYFNGAHRPEYDLVVTTTSWIITVTLLEGQSTKIEFTLTDKAGNESDKVLYGYAMPDTTAPTVTITAPESGISTDATSIILEATVTKDIWETYAELMVRIDATSLTAPFIATNVLSDVGKLTRAVELVEGPNTISVSAQDVAGNWSTVKTVTVTRTVTPWGTPWATYPTADVYAFSGYGTGYSKSQLKFDISSIPSGSQILSAKLWLYRLAADNWDWEILLNRVDDQLWSENITAIEFDAQTLTNEETRASKFISPGWDYLDLKNQLNVDHEAGHAYSSYRLRWANDNGSEPSVGIDDGRFLLIESELDELSIIFSSSEYNGRDPYLEVVYLRPYTVSVSISPTYKSGTLGEELSYTVMVANTGNLDDNYALTVDDNSGWGTTVSPTSLTIVAGASGTATLTVTIPEDAENGTDDNIIVTATSTENTEVSASASCIAQAVRVSPISRGPIYINSNDNFIPANGVTSGSGMENDPYIIENWDISAENAHGIEIRNTTARFVIRNCYVHDGDNFNDGIYFDNVTNGKIDNVTSDNNNQGIVLYNSPNNFIENCIISNSSYLGIWLGYSANNILRNNILSNNKYAFGVWSYENIYEFYQDVDNSNSIDGKPIYYVVEQENLIFDGNLMDIGYLGLISSENILVKNLDMSNVFHGILLANTSYSTIENSTFSNTYWGIDLNASSNNVFTSCTVSYSVTGIAPYGSSDNNIIENCTLENNSRDGIRVEPFSSNNIVRNSIIENNLYGIIIYNFADNNLISNNIVKNNYYGIHLEYSSDHNTLTNNTCENNGRNGISLDRGSSNNTIENCTVLNNYGGIALYDSSNNTLSNNIVANNGPWSGIYLRNSNNNLIENCTAENGLGRGIMLSSSSNNTVENCAVENNDNDGIYLENSDNNLISNNLVENNDGGILLLYSSNNNELVNNKCEKNGHSIYLNNSDNNLISNNLVGNNNYGILLHSSDNNLVTNNLVENNNFGILLHSSDNNLIYHNNLLSNIIQAYDDGSNYWDNGYPSGGNYWSDYTGVDENRGENQDIPGSDGIGDTPYIIPSDNNRDRYPLMEPWPPKVKKVSWDALIAASFSGGSDDAVFGVRPDATSGFDNAYDIPEPPPPAAPPYVRTFFYYPEQTPDKLHHSYLAPENLMEWPLRIEYADNIENVTLTWGVENVPTEYNVLLYRGEDLIADMRAENNYTFEAMSENHDFRVLVGELLPFTLELTQGWNMISFPVLPENSSPDAIFGSYYVLYRWDAENKRYVLHADSGSFIEPDPIVEVGVGYWAYVLEDENVALLGVPVNQLTLSLRLGWNLIGPPYRGSSIADPIDDPDNTVVNWAFTWDANQRRYMMVQLLEPGKGYWVYALGNCSLALFG